MNSKINYVLRFDGASRGNPGHSSYGFVIYYRDYDKDNLDILIYSEGEYIGKATNNQAEYRALLEGIRWCKKKGLKNIRIEGDSLLVINQVRGIWLVKDKELKLLYNYVIGDIVDLGYIELQHIDRKFNTDADKVCNEVLDLFLEKKN